MFARQLRAKLKGRKGDGSPYIRGNAPPSEYSFKLGHARGFSRGGRCWFRFRDWTTEKTTAFFFYRPNNLGVSCSITKLRTVWVNGEERHVVLLRCARCSQRKTKCWSLTSGVSPSQLERVSLATKSGVLSEQLAPPAEKLTSFSRFLRSSFAARASPWRRRRGSSESGSRRCTLVPPAARSWLAACVPGAGRRLE